MGKEIKNENINICRECGGMCCKKSGCDYSANDFKNCSYDNLLKELLKGDKSIICYIKFNEDNNGNLTYSSFLYLRARNNNRGPVDLISLKTGCALLMENGCPFDYKHRPEGGRNLKPVKSSEGSCRPVKNPIDISMSWKPHQKTLRRLVLNITGMNVEQKISEDVENLFYDVLMKKFDGVSLVELEDIKGFVPLLIRTFPNEFDSAMKKYKNNQPKVLVKKN